MFQASDVQCLNRCSTILSSVILLETNIVAQAINSSWRLIREARQLMSRGVDSSTLSTATVERLFTPFNLRLLVVKYVVEFMAVLESTHCVYAQEFAREQQKQCESVDGIERRCLPRLIFCWVLVDLIVRCYAVVCVFALKFFPTMISSIFTLIELV